MPTPVEKFKRRRTQGLQVDRDRYLEVSKDELENIALESTRTSEIDELIQDGKKSLKAEKKGWLK